jgi:hypothetical protein
VTGTQEQEARERSDMLLKKQQQEHEQMLQSVRDQEAAARRKLQASHDVITNMFQKKANEIREQHLTMQVNQEQMALTITQLKDAQKQYELREAQYKARFTVQEERIKDLDQQLTSLYTAFQLLREEHDVEAQSRKHLYNNLHEADAQVARQVEDFEKQGQRKSFGSPRSMRKESPSGMSSSRSIMSSSPGGASYGPSTPAAVGKQLDYPFTPSTLGSPTSATNSSSIMATSKRSGSTLNTWQILGTPGSSSKSQSVTTTPQGSGGGGGEIIMTGTLLVRSKSMIKKWKSKSSALSLKFTHFQWDLDGKSYTLLFGVSKVEYSSNYPLSFAVHVNPYDKTAPIVHAAAVNERDYARWMAALTRATTGGEEEYYEAMNHNNGAAHPTSNSSSSTLQTITTTTPGSPQRSVLGRPSSLEASSARSISNASAEEQEATELEIALQLSQQEM